MWLEIALWGTSLWGPPNDVTDVGQYLRLVNVAGDRPLGHEFVPSLPCITRHILSYQIRAQNHILTETLQQT